MSIMPERCRRAALALPLMSVLAAGGLMGCAAEMPSPPGNDRFLVEPIRLTHQIAFAADDAEFGAAEQYELAAFLDEADPDGQADIYLDARGPERASRVDAVADMLGGLGRESAGSGGGKGTEHGVTVTLLQDVVLPEACLNSDHWPDPRLMPASCANALALVQMMEDPNDLIRGRDLSPALSATAAQAAVRHLRKNAPGGTGQPASSEDGSSELPPSPPTQNASY